MTRRNIAQRLERIEAQQSGPAKIAVCWCCLPPGQHKPGCEAAGAGDDAHVIRVTWAESKVDHA